MPSRYHPIEDEVWDDQKFDPDVTRGMVDASFGERAFFVFLFSNKMQRVAGIYRATDAEFSAASRLPLGDVQGYLHTLEQRRLIVRDGNWIFTPGYLKRQSKNPRYMQAVCRSVGSCSSTKVLLAFAERYPLYSHYLPDGLKTVSPPSGDHVAFQLPSVSVSEAVSVPKKNEEGADPAVPANLQRWLGDTHHLKSLAHGKHGKFWATMERAYDRYDWLFFEVEIKKADAWIAANPNRAPTPNGLPRFIRNWFERSIEKGRRNAQGSPPQTKR